MNMPQLKRIQIELTGRCNERCVHCYIPHENKIRDIDFGILMGTLDQCKDMGVGLITFSGGEPLLYPQFMEAVARANRHGFKICILSNLTLLDESLIKELKKHQIFNVQTSLYSVDAEIHDAVTKMAGSCELTKRNIVKLAENNIPVSVRCVVTRLNKNSYPGVLAFARQLGANAGPDNMIMAQSDHTAKNIEYRLNTAEALQVIRDILENDTAYEEEQFLPGYCNLTEALPGIQKICTDTICVNAQGEVIPLPAWNKVLGCLDTQTLREIWGNSSEIKKIRNITLDDFPKCVICPDIYFCNMCLESSANENSTGDPFIIPNHICEIAKETRKLVHSYNRLRSLTRGIKE